MCQVLHLGSRPVCTWSLLHDSIFRQGSNILSEAIVLKPWPSCSGCCLFASASWWLGSRAETIWSPLDQIRPDAHIWPMMGLTPPPPPRLPVLTLTGGLEVDPLWREQPTNKLGRISGEPGELKPTSKQSRQTRNNTREQTNNTQKQTIKRTNTHTHNTHTQHTRTTHRHTRHTRHTHTHTRPTHTHTHTHTHDRHTHTHTHTHTPTHTHTHTHTHTPTHTHTNATNN